MNEYDLGCSVEHHFVARGNPISADEHEKNEKRRLLKFPKHERSLWCWICGFMLDPCDYPTPKEGVGIFERHLKKCEDGWRNEGREETL
jgi:hypothetical protein